MSSKLTKDQKREKKKRDERRANARRVHESNLHIKKFEGLMATLDKAMLGISSQDELDAALLRVGEGQSVAMSDKGSRFKGEMWDKLKQMTSHMVSLLYQDNDNPNSVFAIQGRVYMGTENSKEFRRAALPLFAVFSSRWTPGAVVPELAKELNTNITQGAYFFGVEARNLALHFAVATTTDEQDTPEVFCVTRKGWHRLALDNWNHAILPVMARLLAAERLGGQSRDTDMAIAELMGAFAKEGDEIDPDMPTMGERQRATVMNMCSDLLFESDTLLGAAQHSYRKTSEMAATEAWNEGFEARQQEINVLESRNQHLEMQARQMQRNLEALESGPIGASGHQLQPSPAKPLHERMGALLGL